MNDILKLFFMLLIFCLFALLIIFVLAKGLQRGNAYFYGFEAECSEVNGIYNDRDYVFPICYSFDEEGYKFFWKYDREADKMYKVKA